MANEIVATTTSGATLYAVLLNAIGQAYNGSIFETPGNANWATYDLALSEAGTTGIYRGSMPAVAAGAYAFFVYQQAGGAPAVGDECIGAGSLQWDGTAEVALATINANVLTRTSLGGGAITFVYTLTSSVDASPLADADVWVTSDEAGNILLASGHTNASGQITFYLDAGTVYIWRQKSGWNFANPDMETVN